MKTIKLLFAIMIFSLITSAICGCSAGKPDKSDGGFYSAEPTVTDSGDDVYASFDSDWLE